MPLGDVLIEVTDVAKHFGEGPTRVDALRSVDLTVRAGEVIALLGPSGSGKTTLLNIIGCILAPSSGKVVLDGEPVFDGKWLRRDLRRLRLDKIGFIFQSFNLMPYYTALENVALPLSFSGVPLAQRTKRAKQMLDVVGLSTHMKHKPSELSGGQQQRVGIARALVTNPSIVFADEPTGNLDSNTSDEVMQVIINIMREQKKTLIMVTHDPHIAEYGDKVVHLLDGRITDISINAKDSTTLNEPRVRETEGILNA